MRNRIKKKKKKVQSMDPTIKSQSGCYLELSESDCYLLGEGTIERRENDTIHLIFQGHIMNQSIHQQFTNKHVLHSFTTFMH
ncbi:hypothetical protein AAZX31_01G007400 [Glycine max]|uniref:Uncharacterized protein n=2 Tax=Glycine subgen. Soja TaxID=1462606 RepID=K7K148_SOYBN|nr:hypothetical protein JHK87_000074 [Glycine soja]KAG5067695.1 hypothetical protein JHK85_000072 [Glycine max]KAG5087458.1 hypothetical protein JHK86_000070 [Glycine max]KAH1161011.1 hypothetical protein GYH30_000077 [Glycine max]KRH74251.1 hypothetical protein GLYMA_01G007600v4 [Glycine max]